MPLVLIQNLDASQILPIIKILGCQDFCSLIVKQALYNDLTADVASFLQHSLFLQMPKTSSKYSTILWRASANTTI